MLNSQLKTSQSNVRHQARDLEKIFERAYFADYNTRLCGGGAEPEYIPAQNTVSINQLVYREDFFASALHETAHWCIAGDARRRQVDFGYWYTAEGRDSIKQKAFFDVEVKPQALELLFSLCANYSFKVSADNAELTIDVRPFSHAVEQQAMQYCKAALPNRAWIFCQLLGKHYQPELAAEKLLPYMTTQLFNRTLKEPGQ
jgi:hypothetical protein